MAEVDLLRALPKTKRNIQKRSDAKDASVVQISKQFGEMYFDGPREYGYGGYRYDGRWMPVARDIVDHFGLKPGMRVLDVGGAKGFLVKDLMQVCPRLDAFGLDISAYALMHCEPEAIGRLHLGTAESLPFPDRSFDAVISINTIHNLDHDGCLRALREMTRLCRDPAKCYVQVDAYRTDNEKALFESWCLTAITYLTPAEWVGLFRMAGYAGDYYWTILQGA
ncbi:MAG TPA: class I SAM-dependent methyltransferase [Xanthobacteraceae bacterium]|jgi:cyclopropane fatty-acyl-phospholipid synthase-like methyltransferase